MFIIFNKHFYSLIKKSFNLVKQIYSFCYCLQFDFLYKNYLTDHLLGVMNFAFTKNAINFKYQKVFKKLTKSRK